MDDQAGSLIGAYIHRPNEYERIIAFLLDQRFFLPTAITTSLPGGRGFGKTTLARAICTDPRVREAFSEGILWVTLGTGLAPLDLLSRIEGLIYDLSGERAVFNDIEEAKQQLHQLLHPRKTLLVIDEADDPEALEPFLQSGPGGACLLIVHDDTKLSESARRVHVDITMPEESAAMLTAGFPELPCVEGGARRASAPPAAAESAGEGAETLPPGPGELAEAAPASDVAAPAPGTAAPALDLAPLPPLSDYPAEVQDLLVSLSDRLGEWPLLLTLANGMLRTWHEAGTPGCENLAGALRTVHQALDSQHLETGWHIVDPVERKRALDCVIAASLELFSPEDRERYIELSVFPPEENVPVASVAVLWNMDLDETYFTCARLAGVALVEMDPERWTIRLHSAILNSLIDQLWVGQLAALNNRLVEHYAARCPDGWSTGPDDGYFFQHLAGHMAQAGRRSEISSLLLDFTWLYGYLHCSDCSGGRRGDMYSLLSDFDVALSGSLDNQSAQLRLVKDALRLSAPVLAKDGQQLAPQLLGRLLPFNNEPEVKELLRSASSWQAGSWLRPLAACFTPPGGEEVRVLPGHNDWVTGVELLPDGQHAVSSSLDGTLRVWNLANGQVIRVIEVTPDDDLAFARLAGPAETSREVPRAAGMMLRQLGTAGALAGPPMEVHPGGIGAMVITGDGLKAITAGWDGMLHIWNLATGQEERSIQAHIEAVSALTITPDSRYVISGADDRLIRIWDLESGELVHELVGHGDLVRALAVTPDGRSLVSGSWDYTVRLWDLEHGALLHILTGHNAWVQAVAVTPDGYNVISSSWDRTMREWDLWTGEVVRDLTGLRTPVFSMAFTPDGNTLITGSGDGSLSLWNYETGKIERTLGGHSGGINALSLSKGGRFAVTGSDDGTLRVWDLVAVRSGSVRTGHDAPVFAMVNLPGARELPAAKDLPAPEDPPSAAEAVAGARVRPATGSLSKPPEPPAVEEPAAPNGSTLVSASWDGTLKVWQPTRGREMRTLKGHGGGVVAMALSNDGRYALTGSRDQTLKLWDLQEGAELATLTGHSASITSVALTPDAQVAASGDEAGIVCVWDIPRRALLAEFRGEASIWAIAITPDGQTVTASESGGKMYFLQVEKEKGP